MSRILVTGATGFVGTHLLSLMREEGDHTISGTTRRPASRLPWFEQRGRLFHGDLQDQSFVDEVVSTVRPEFVIHLAAQAAVGQSWQDPRGTLINNLVAQLNVLESVASQAPDARVLVSCSSHEYGPVEPSEVPLSEDAPLRPDSPYALSKVIQDYLGLHYFLGRHVAVVRVRAFNLIGPGQDGQFVIPSFARQIAEAEAGLGSSTIQVGNLDVRRDFTDVRDAVAAYWLLAQRGYAGQVYNVGGGTICSVGDILSGLIRLAKLSIEVVVNPSLVRPSEPPLIESDTRRIRQDVKWRPQIPIEDSLADILDDWRRRIAAGPDSGER